MNIKVTAMICIVCLAVGIFGGLEYNHYFPKPPVIPPPVIQPVTPPVVQPQPVTSTTGSDTSVSVQPVTEPATVVDFVQQQGKVVLKVNGQTQEVPNLTGKPDITLGQDGTLHIVTGQTATVDVSGMVQNQVDAAVANANKQFQAQLDAEKKARIKERILWGTGTVVLIYLLARR
jgi:hypothetical protein